MKTLYQNIKNRLATNLPQVKYVALYNNQFSQEKDEKTFTYPATLVEFSTFEYSQYPNGIQKYKGTIRLHCGFKTLLPEDDLTLLESVDAIAAALMNWQPSPGDSPLIRTMETIDTNHNHIYVHIIEFMCAGVDLNGWLDKGKSTIGPLADNIAKEIEIDNYVIRTGKLD